MLRICSQGMNTGIQDAYNLAWKLDVVLRGSDSSLLSTFQEECLLVAARILGLSTKLLVNFQSPERSLPTATERLQADLNYRSSSLSRHTLIDESLLHAGDRSPDARITDANGKQTRVFDLFRGKHFSILYTGTAHIQRFKTAFPNNGDVKLFLINRDAKDITGNNMYADLEESFSKVYGLEKDIIYLVRPDGYTAFVGEGNAKKLFAGYLKKLSLSIA